MVIVSPNAIVETPGTCWANGQKSCWAPWPGGTCHTWKKSLGSTVLWWRGLISGNHFDSRSYTTRHSNCPTLQPEPTSTATTPILGQRLMHLEPLDPNLLELILSCWSAWSASARRRGNSHGAADSARAPGTQPHRRQNCWTRHQSFFLLLLLLTFDFDSVDNPSGGGAATGTVDDSSQGEGAAGEGPCKLSDLTTSFESIPQHMSSDHFTPVGWARGWTTSQVYRDYLIVLSAIVRYSFTYIQQIWEVILVYNSGYEGLGFIWFIYCPIKWWMIMEFLHHSRWTNSGSIFVWGWKVTLILDIQTPPEKVFNLIGPQNSDTQKNSFHLQRWSLDVEGFFRARENADWKPTTKSGWWFPIFFIFTPIWGRFPFWRIFFKGVETTN